MSRLREAWQSRRRPAGTFVFSRDAAVSEVIGRAGFDFTVVDLEHAALDLRDVEGHIRAAAASGISALVRVPSTGDTALCARLLDLGAHGILFPHFGMDIEGAHEAIATLRYAPAGRRPSCTGVRATDYGLGNFAEHVRQSDNEIVGVGLIEDEAAIEDIDALLARARPDAIMPGPGDLATSMGLAGQPHHPRVREAVVNAAAGARRAGVRVGLYLNSVEEVTGWADIDADFFVYLVDLKILALALRDALDRIRRGAGTERSGA
jgi:2-keto-3-deoxy-L-rhamnonate aldolase RhmA